MSVLQSKQSKGLHESVSRALQCGACDISYIDEMKATEHGYSSGRYEIQSLVVTHHGAVGS